MSRYSRSVGTSDRVYKAEVDVLSSEPSKTHELLKDLAKGPFSTDELEPCTWRRNQVMRISQI